MSSRPASSDPPVRAAYGLRLAGVDGGGALAAANGEPWPELRVERRIAPRTSVARGFGGRRACFPMYEGRLLLERARQTITTVTEEPLPDDLLVHPWLTLAGAMWARWLGRDAFHGAALMHGDGAWAVLAAKAGGKSTLLGWLAARGESVIADDLLVIEDGHVFAGPRCVDLRPEVASALSLEELPLARADLRRRLRLGAVPASVPLRGVVHLEWADELDLRQVPLAERIGRLRAQNNFAGIPAGSATLLELAALPTFELRRPRDVERLGESAEALLGALQAGRL